MAKCDLCSTDCRASDMVELLPAYRIPGVVDICKPCGDWATKQKFKFLGEIPHRMREVIAERRGVTAPKRRFFRFPWSV